MTGDPRPTMLEPGATRWDGPSPTERDDHGPALPTWSVGNVIEGTYEVRRLFAAGGMGLVYLVWHRGWGMELAVKQPRPELFRSDQQRADFEREAEAWANLGLHPNIITCHYVRRIDGIPCVFAEYAVGGSLAERLREGALPVAQAIDIAIQVAWGIEHAHHRGFIHQDIKPANVLLSDLGLDGPAATLQDGESRWPAAKLTDFGLASARAGPSLFTPEYASPEQYARQPINRATDIWSWAVTVLEMITGQRPAIGPAARELLSIVDHAHWPMGLHELLQTCLMEQPGDRPTDMGQLADLLQAIASTAFPGWQQRRRPRSATLDLDARNNRAVSLFDLGKRDEAEVLWSEVLRAQRDHSEALYNLGLIRWRQGSSNFAELMAELRELVAAYPDDFQPSRFMARVSLEAGDATRALELIARDLSTESAAVRTEAEHQLERFPKCLWTRPSPAAATIVAWAGEKRLVSLHRDRHVRCWGVDGELLATLPGHQGLPDRIAVSADGEFALSTAFFDEPSAPAEIALWGLCPPRLIWRTDQLHLERPCGMLRPVDTDGEMSIAFDGSSLLMWYQGSPVRQVMDVGHTLVSVRPLVTMATDGDRQIIRTWSSTDLELKDEFEVHPHATDLRLTADGRFITGRALGRLMHWSVGDGQEGLGPPPGDTGYRAIGEGPMEYSNHQITIWHLERDRPVAVFAPHGDCPDLSLSQDASNRLAIAWNEGLSLWRLDTNSRPFDAPFAVCRARRSEAIVDAEDRFDREIQRAHSAIDRGAWIEAATAVRQARSVPGGNRRREALALWDAIGNHLEAGPFRRGWWQEGLAAPAVRGLAMTPDGQRLAIAEHLRFRVWDLVAGRAVITTDAPAGRTVALAPDGQTVFTSVGVAGRNLKLAATDVASGRVIWTADLSPLTCGFGDLRVSSDGSTLFSVHGDHSVRRWCTRTGELRSVYTRSLSGVTRVATSDDGRWFAAILLGERDVRLIDASTGDCLQVVAVDQPTDIAMAQGLLAIAEGADVPMPSSPPTLTLWDVRTGTAKHRLVVPMVDIQCLSMAADGQLLIAGGKDGAAAWDTRTGQLLRKFTTHGDTVQAVAASNERRFVATAAGNSIRLWQLDWEISDHARTFGTLTTAEPPLTNARGPCLSIQRDRDKADPVESTDESEPLILWMSKLVLHDDGLYRGRWGGKLELLHTIDAIREFRLVRRLSVGAFVALGMAIALGVAAIASMTGVWSWVIGGVSVFLFMVTAGLWRFPQLRVTTADGDTDYELRDPAVDVQSFVMTLQLMPRSKP